MNKAFRIEALEIQPCKKQRSPPLRSGSGVKSLLHSQFALSAALFIAQAETAELTAVMSLALMECFVPPCVRACVRARVRVRERARHLRSVRGCESEARCRSQDG